jgi:hypothetical protein
MLHISGRQVHHLTADADGREEGTKVKKFGFAAVIATGMSAAVLGLAAPAMAEYVTPVGPTYTVDNHDQTNTTNGWVDRPF